MITTKLEFVEPAQVEDAAARKKRLRSYMKERRGDNENRDVKELLLLDNLFKGLTLLKEKGILRDVKSAFVYLSYSLEAPTDKLVEQLKAYGVRVYAPVLQKGEMFAVECGEEFSLSHLGIREPIGTPMEGDCDIAIIPLLAVDKQGNRLGYGGGYYDRYLRAHAKTVRIGYCFDFQVLPVLPSEETDEKMQMIVTDKRLFMI